MDWVRRHFDPSGRTSRLGYWRFQIMTIPALAIVMIFTVFLTQADQPGLAALVFSIPMLIGLAGAALIAVRRMHDRNRSGWWLILFVAIPLLLSAAAQTMVGSRDPVDILIALAISAVVVGLSVWSWLEFGVFRGTRGPNRFGPDPGL